MKIYMLIPIILMAIPYTSYSQDTLFQKIPDKIAAGAKKYQTRVEMCADKALFRLIKQERNMQRELWKIDSSAAKRIFTDSLTQLKSRLNNNVLSNIPGSSYLDTIQLSLQFLQNENAFKSIQELQGKLQQAEQIQAYINHRKQELITELSKYASFNKHLQAISKEGFIKGLKVDYLILGRRLIC